MTKSEKAKSLSRVKVVHITTVIEIKDDIEERERAITVKKAPLGNWKRLTDSAKKLLNLLPEVLEEKGIKEKEEMEAYFDQMGYEDILMLLPDMMEVAFDEVINILSLGSDIDREVLEKQVGLDEAIELFEAIVEVNNLVKVVKKGKNFLNLLSGMGITGRR